MADPAAPKATQASLESKGVDIMGDHLYAANNTNVEDGTGDPDTCRICRGEATDKEPLFYPCKCSGSIKFVHQDCLMEWLSHSQKKHCELCKTPFRFTKLYSPNMPHALPPHIFARHFFFHVLKNLATWLRFCLVVTVWLGCLPYIIRQVWRLIFWFSDGGWPSTYVMIDPAGNSTSTQALEIARELQIASLTGTGTSPVTPLLASQTTSANIGGLMEKLVSFLMPFSQTLNVSGSDPLAASLFKSLYYGLGIQSVVIPDGPINSTSISQLLQDFSPTSRSPSLLSDVFFLKNFTRHSYINQIIITIAEGYVITILVVLSFILVFLIREWVVQQQPGINMGAGFNADFAGPDRPRDQQALPDEPLNPELVPIIGAGHMVDNPPAPRGVELRPIARPRRRNVQLVDVDEAIPRLPRNNSHQEMHLQREPESDAGETSNKTGAEITIGGLSSAAEIQRRFTEEPRMTEEFLAIWRRADSNPKEVLRIIEGENLGDQMRYWVNAMKILQSPQDVGFHEQRISSPTDLPLSDRWVSPNTQFASGPAISSTGSITADSLVPQDESHQSSRSSDSWVDVPMPLNIRRQNILAEETNDHNKQNLLTEETLTPHKGKGKAGENPHEPLSDHNAELLPEINWSQWNTTPSNGWNTIATSSDVTSFTSGNTRPRAISDGPHRKDNISPLANNNWTFSKLPDAEDKIVSDSPSLDENEKFIDADLRSLLDNPNPPSESAVPKSQISGSQSWNNEQDGRVQQAIARGREAHKSALQRHIPAVAIPTTDLSDFEGPIHIQGLDGVMRTARDWDEEFENHPVLDSSDSEDGVEDRQTEQNLFPNEVLLAPEVQEIVLARPVEPLGFLGHVADWLWGGAGHDGRQDEQDGDDEHVIEDLAAEAPFVPVVHNGLLDRGDNENAGEDREVVEAAIAAGLDPNDPDGIDDAEDFEGIMELVGMRGPLFGLIQNALFSAFLLALTVAFGVWIPYNVGRVSLLLAANPGPAFKLPLRLVFGCAAFLQDLGLALLGTALFCTMAMFSLPANLWSYYTANADAVIVVHGYGFGSAAFRFSHDAVDRIVEGTLHSLIHVADSEIFAFSAASHESLIAIKLTIANVLGGVSSGIIFLFAGDYCVSLAGVKAAVQGLLIYSWQFLAGLPQFLARPDSWVISLEVTKRTAPLDLELSIWNGMDRFWATLAGYTTLSIIGALYVKKGSPFSNGQVGREWEATIIDLLHQAGGVMKVILIISIEMLVFPLYCGLLLDAALLPLFENATVMSRILFTFKSPLTSIFVHWFIGTCYMFHFALFVSMCRKIMRKGVLYFIRDPDDPTFHPVRDVLERNVATQLRKILFSAFVYGALVVICLGGVVWGLSLAFRGVLPIHWSSNEPVLEFPVDLLFYNFLMPLAVRFFKPSDGLHAMYSWWFRCCARMLRLTWFLFDERRLDEEGYHTRQTWKDFLRGAKGDPLNMIKTEDVKLPFIENPEMRAYFRQDGRYVRVPASDQVRIPKGVKIFLQVDELNNRIDGEWDSPDGIHGRDSELYKQVYIPPWFRMRIGLLILFIWLFAAITGVCITIVPLVFGRHLFSKIIPSHVRKNDVYAFSIGIYVLGSVLYAALHLSQGLNYLRTAFAINAETPKNVLRRIRDISSRIARITWTYTAFLFILPGLFAFLVEFYFIVPLHTYFEVEERHVVHFVQSWTLGLLYVKLTTRIILWYEDSRPAEALRAITRDGYLNPDARLATRSFILPASLLLSTALFVPWWLARIATATMFKDAPERHVLVYRYAYPMVLCIGVTAFAAGALVGLVAGWRQKIKDEVYLIGERLHNFGERKAPAVGVGLTSLRRID